MKCVIFLVIVFPACLINALSSEEYSEVTDLCCDRGASIAVTSSSPAQCADAAIPEEVDPEQLVACKAAILSCCEDHLKKKTSCDEGIKLGPKKQCEVPKTEIGKTCCEECSIGRLSGEGQGIEACGSPPGDDVSPITALRKTAYYQCCMEAANKPTTTTEKVETTTKPVPKVTCRDAGCEHSCDDTGEVTRCVCREGYRLKPDQKGCVDINECMEAVDDLCTVEDTVCHNVPGSFKCVPIVKRDVGLSCPPGFKRNVVNQVCDDINECQLPRPPCPKYLCENTIGAYKCAGKLGKPSEELPGPGAAADPDADSEPKIDICPPGFRAGDDDECFDIDECSERSDDCQRLSQHCINTHGGFFCQDHVSKRCAPGFKVNTATGICEDIDECEESSEVCKKSEVCINLPGAYNCKSKISQLPKLATKTCQEGTRLRPGGKTCEDIDECREGTHLCDRFQNCINTFGGHECRCKNGFELDSSSGSCVDINECELKLDDCAPGLHCLNVLGSFTCTKRPVTSSTTTTEAPVYEYYYDEDNSTDTDAVPDPEPPTPKPTPRPTRPTPRPTRPARPPTRTPRPTPRATTTESTTTPIPTPISSTTTPRPRPYHNPSRPERPTTPEKPENKPNRRPYDRPSVPERPPTPNRPERPNSIPRTPEEPENKPDRRPYDRPSTPERPTPSRPERPNTIPTNPVEPENKPDRRPYDRPTRPDSRRPDVDRRPPARRPTTPTRRPETATVPTPTERNKDDPFDPNEVFCLDGLEKDANGVCVEKSTNVISPPEPEEVKCESGYEKDIHRNCIDIDECQKGIHVCGNLEKCVNHNGGYTCECISGFVRGTDGWCAVITTSSTTSTTTTTTTTTERSTPPSSAGTSPDWSYSPYRPPSPPRGGRVYPPLVCELGYRFDSTLQRCVDVDECSMNKDTCGAQEDCINMDGGFKCVCGTRCRPRNEKPTFVAPPPRRPLDGGSNVITVGAQYGQRGPWSPRPIYTRDHHQNSYTTSCPWGYRLTSDNRCYDIDECEKGTSECGPKQRCENFYGGYSCQCAAGHRLVGDNDCEDIDECAHGNPCSYNGRCVNTVGSYRCECSEGFRSAPSNDKVCVDIDECTQTPEVCHHNCANAWGSYRCYCRRGYRLEKDNRTCADVNECEEWSAARARGRLCAGECVNEPGSYRCACPHGYRLSEDHRTCIDIDECENGEALCGRGSDPGAVCQNTRGGYHCHHIDCPPGYKLESKHRCTRIQRSCPISDWSCLQRPSSYSYNFITFVANIYLPTGSVDLFTMHGPTWSDSVVSFEMRMVNVQAGEGVTPADLTCFDMRPLGSTCAVSLLCPLAGPQVAELELTMSLYQRGQFAGSAVARLIIIVSQYEF